MEEQVHELAMLVKAVRDLKAEIAEKEARLAEAVKVLVAETCTTDKKIEIPTGFGPVNLYARDYKKFPEDVELSIMRREDAYKDEIAPLKKQKEAEVNAIKRKAEAEGKMTIDRRWYVKGLGSGE